MLALLLHSAVRFTATLVGKGHRLGRLPELSCYGLFCPADLQDTFIHVQISMSVAILPSRRIMENQSLICLSCF
jgi:hypothetical protein